MNSVDEMIYEIVDDKVKKNKLYLDPHLTLEKLCDVVGANRTYVSRAVCSRHKNLKDYLNGMRTENLIEEITSYKCNDSNFEDLDELACSYGFPSRKSMDRILAKHTGVSYRSLRKRLKRESYR